MPWRHCIGQDFFFWISFLHDFLNLFKKNLTIFTNSSLRQTSHPGGRSWTISFCSQVSHHERALVNDLQSVSKKLSETRSRIGLKSMKINVGSQKTIQKKTLQTKNVTEKKRYRKKSLHTNTAWQFSQIRRQGGKHWTRIYQTHALTSSGATVYATRTGIRRAAFHAVPAAFATMMPPTLSQKVGKYASELVFSYLGSEASYTE